MADASKLKMPVVSKLSLYGDVYDIKDASARTNAQAAQAAAEAAQQTASSANQTANTAKSTATAAQQTASGALQASATAQKTANLALTGANKITYDDSNESIVFTKVEQGQGE